MQPSSGRPAHAHPLPCLPAQHSATSGSIATSAMVFPLLSLLSAKALILSFFFAQRQQASTYLARLHRARFLLFSCLIASLCFSAMQTSAARAVASRIASQRHASPVRSRATSQRQAVHELQVAPHGRQRVGGYHARGGRCGTNETYAFGGYAEQTTVPFVATERLFQAWMPSRSQNDYQIIKERKQKRN